ncbi:RING-H2 finger protein ATL22-like [Henckelia pumila]|uniref:RING-H2 finger protein ATL22-like n=1 Tax=Henckelia pumila TaxID=405737 RepID=UPI003C6E5407
MIPRRMETIAKSFVLSSSLLTFFSILARCSDPCQPAACDASMDLKVRFPFRLVNRHPAGCGYPGFDLHCDGKNRTILNLPRSGEFRVNYIDYSAQALLINDPDSCLPNRILNFSLSDSSFSGAFVRRYAFFNCSSSSSSARMNYSSSYSYPFVVLDCLSRGNYTVVAVRSRLSAADVPPSCRSIESVSVPLQWSTSPFYWESPDLMEDLELVWREPNCWDCENRGGICGYSGGSGRDIGCSTSSRSGLPRSAKYGIIIGIGIPGLLCILGLASYSFGMIKNRTRSNSDLSASTIPEPQSEVRAVGGLDMPTIASYPKIMLGESGRLPDPANRVCPICLCDYQPKEGLRSIPECNHYFHVGCIDEWLKLNGTCPLCRNSPPTSTATPTSTMSLSSSHSTPSNH